MLVNSLLGQKFLSTVFHMKVRELPYVQRQPPTANLVAANRMEMDGWRFLARRLIYRNFLYGIDSAKAGYARKPTKEKNFLTPMK